MGTRKRLNSVCDCFRPDPSKLEYPQFLQPIIIFTGFSGGFLVPWGHRTHSNDGARERPAVVLVCNVLWSHRSSCGLRWRLGTSTWWCLTTPPAPPTSRSWTVETSPRPGEGSPPSSLVTQTSLCYLFIVQSKSPKSMSFRTWEQVGVWGHLALACLQVQLGHWESNPELPSH